MFAVSLASAARKQKPVSSVKEECLNTSRAIFDREMQQFSNLTNPTPEDVGKMVGIWQRYTFRQEDCLALNREVQKLIENGAPWWKNETIWHR